ncbi:MAG: hypothetical protein ACFFCP_18900 [Promethearchaeota archaeon]
MQNTDRIFKMIAPYLDLVGSLKDHHGKDTPITQLVMDHLKRGDYSACVSFLKDSLSNSEKDEFCALINYHSVYDLLSPELTEDQKKSLVRNNLIEIPGVSGRFDFTSISAITRVRYIDEHLNAEAQFDSNRGRLFSEIRGLFGFYGEDVKLSDLINEEERNLLSSCSVYDSPWHALRYMERHIDDMYYYVIRIPPGEFIIVMDEEEVKYESKKKPYSVKSSNLTPRGYVIVCCLSELFANEFSISSIEKPIRDFEPFKDTYYHPDTEDRILRKYYDETYGFRQFVDFMEKKEDLLKTPRMWPRYLQVQPDPKYRQFKKELIRLNVLNAEKFSLIEDFFIKQVDNLLSELLPNRQSYPFLISRMLHDDYPVLYERIKDQVMKDLHNLFLVQERVFVNQIRESIGKRMLYACVFYDTVLNGESVINTDRSGDRLAERIINDTISYMVNEVFDLSKDTTLRIEWESLPEPTNKDIAGALLSNSRDISNRLDIVRAFLIFLFGKDITPEQIH